MISPTISLRSDDGELAALTKAARADLESLAHPARPWIDERLGPDGRPVLDVLLVGAGQSGIIAAAALQREGVHRVAVVDRAPAGREGPWNTFARMPELRTPKSLVGSELGIPSLSVRRWFEARHGAGTWDDVGRLSTEDWRSYLDWHRQTTGVTVDNEVEVRRIDDAGDGVVRVTVDQAGDTRTHHARAVVLTTGFDGAGAWKVPAFVSDHLDPSRYDHSNTPFDLARVRGKRVGVLGHGASAFDNASAAIEAGAISVDVCFRRERLPRTNPHRHIETAGLMTHYPELDDETRWQIAQYFRSHDQPPPEPSFRRATALPGVTVHPATPWLAVREQSGEVVVDTPRGPRTFDHLILATGAINDLVSRPELAALAPLVRRWSDARPARSDDHDPGLATLPYLDPGYAFKPIDGDNDAWVRRVFAFNALSYVSHGPHSTSISGHRHALPRLVRGVVRQLFLDTAPTVLRDLRGYRSDDLDIPDDYEAICLAGAEQTDMAPEVAPA